MISAIQLKEFGIGVNTTESDLEEVNRCWEGAKYHDTQANKETSMIPWPPLT